MNKFSQQQIKLDERIFAIADIVGQAMLAHKAVHQAHMAAQGIGHEAVPATSSYWRLEQTSVAVKYS